MKHLTALWTAVLFGSMTTAYGQTTGNVYQATLGESGQRTVEVSTEQLRGILADMSAVVLDARPLREYAISHIPGAKNVAAKPGVSMSAYVSDVAEVGRLLEGKKQTRWYFTVTVPTAVRASGLPRSSSRRATPTFVAISSVFQSGAHWAA